MRWNPLGRTCSRKRRMNSSGASVIVRYRACPLWRETLCRAGARPAARGEADQPAVGEGDAVGIAGEISEYRLGPGERRLGIDEPVLPSQRREIGGEGRSVP